MLLAGFGAWNYQRNIEAEAAKPRPYKAYADEQLVQLRTAYEGQVKQLERRYDTASSVRARSRDVQLLGEAVDQFDRIQRSSRAIRELGAQLSQEEMSLRAIREEQALRARLGGPAMAFLRRVFVPSI